MPYTKANSNLQPFLDTLGETQESLVASGIDFRIVGSVATAALLGQTLDHSRPWKVSKDKQHPDIDLILPREDIPKAWELRQIMLKRDVPVKLGLAIPFKRVDFRPEYPYSYLTNQSDVIEIDNDLLRATSADYNGIDTLTIPPETLIFANGVFGSQVRDKDKESAIQLANRFGIDLASKELEDKYKAFLHVRESNALQHQAHPVRHKTREFIDQAFTGKLPTRFSQFIIEQVYPELTS